MMGEMTNVKRGLESLYRAPYLAEPKTPPVRPILDALLILTDDVIVELGAGDGHFALPIAQELETAASRGVIFACDYAPTLVETMAAMAVDQGVDIHLRAVSLDEVLPQTLPFARERIDSVLSVNTLQYLRDPMPFLREIARVLSPCGHVLIADWGEPALMTSGTYPEKGFSRSDLCSMLDAVGLDVGATLWLDGYNWGIRATKPILLSE